jgi:hypothetical protein
MCAMSRFGSHVKHVFQKLGQGNNKDGSPSGREISRRKAVQWLLAVPGGSLVLRGFIFGHPIYKPLSDGTTVAAADVPGAADWTPEFLDVHQNESLIALAECMIPGSTNAQVNRFIDLLLTVDAPESKENFLASLGAFEAESRSRFAHPFPDLNKDQQTQILTVASTGKPGNAPVSENWSWFSIPSRASSEPIVLTLRDHFENLKSWITGAYYSSEVGMRELGWKGQYFYETFPGCEHSDGHNLS